MLHIIVTLKCGFRGHWRSLKMLLYDKSYTTFYWSVIVNIIIIIIITWSMGEGKLTPLTTPTPLNRLSRNIAHVISPHISPHKRHLVKIAPWVTSPHIAKVTTQFFLISLYAKSFYWPRAQAIEPILTRDTPTDAYSRRVVSIGG